MRLRGTSPRPPTRASHAKFVNRFTRPARGVGDQCRIESGRLMKVYDASIAEGDTPRNGHGRTLSQFSSSDLDCCG